MDTNYPERRVSLQFNMMCTYNIYACSSQNGLVNILCDYLLCVSCVQHPSARITYQVACSNLMLLNQHTKHSPSLAKHFPRQTHHSCPSHDLSPQLIPSLNAEWDQSIIAHLSREERKSRGRREQISSNDANGMLLLCMNCRKNREVRSFPTLCYYMLLIITICMTSLLVCEYESLWNFMKMKF